LPAAVTQGIAPVMPEAAPLPAKPEAAPPAAFVASSTSAVTANTALHEKAMEPAETEKAWEMVALKRSRLREYPSTKSRIILVIDKGTKLEKIDETEGWINVKLSGGDYGWVFGKLLSDLPSREPEESLTSSTDITPSPPDRIASTPERPAKSAEVVKAGEMRTLRVCRLREEPSTNSKIILVLKKGREVEKIGGAGGWVNVKLPWGDSGWIKAELLREISPRPVEAAEILIYVGRTSLPSSPLPVETGKSRSERLGKAAKVSFITLKNVRMRSEPSPESEVVSVLGKGRIVEKISDSGTWAKVKSPWDKVGFIRKDLLEEYS